MTAGRATSSCATVQNGGERGRRFSDVVGGGDGCVLRRHRETSFLFGRDQRSHRARDARLVIGRNNWIAERTKQVGGCATERRDAQDRSIERQVIDQLAGKEQAVVARRVDDQQHVRLQRRLPALGER